MRRFLFNLLFLILLTASCAPKSAPAETEKIPASLVTPAHAPQIRFALIGSPRDVNAWELFDETGANYLDYALRSEYWPRLYHLAPPDFSFQTLAAQGFPAAFIQEGEFYSAVIKLRADLKWTDGSNLTAADVAFTVNTALTFELGFDWRAHYPREYIDHVEALDAATIKFVFKQKPNIRVWQYGALQGVILQKAFWESKITEAAKSLPEDALDVEILESRNRLAAVQWDINELIAKLLALSELGQGSRPLEIDLKHREDELNYARNNLDKLLEEYSAKINATHQVLYALDDENEPTLGVWIFESKKSDLWVNTANPNFPFGKPNFDRAVYYFFDNEKTALAAFKNNEVDFILSPDGIASGEDAETIFTYGARFLVFNPLKTQFADPVFHAALSCMIDRKELAEDILQNKAAPLHTFILSSQWHNPNIKDPCADMEKADRIVYAVNLLKNAGYSWAQQPGKKNAGQKLTNPNGDLFPKIALSAPTKIADALRYTAAKYIAEQAQYLGIPFSVREMSADDVIYAIYSSQKYDAALVGWRLSEYPGYVCEWFGGGNPYLLNSSKYASACEALSGESDFESARESMSQIEFRLVSELPFIPLFTTTRMEEYQNLIYPASVLNGWGGLYGAPLYAMPSP